MSKNVLITGGAGFIGSHIIEHIIKNTDWNIIIIDKLTYATKGLSRLNDFNALSNNRVKFFTYDLSHSLSDGLKIELGDEINYIIHMAADTHVDNSITKPVSFIKNNVMSTLHILEYARTISKTLEKFFYFSTDEVYGSAPDNISYTEKDVHNPSNPYSASKSASEQIAISYYNTYKVPIIITNLMNVFGERQHVEKFIPKCIKYILEGKIIPIHSDKTCTKPGSRFYIHARNVSSAIIFLIKNGVIGEKYNITGEKEMNNLEMALFIAKIIKKELKYNLVDYHSDRPGHDQRYSLCGDKLSDLGWKPPNGFTKSLEKTINWTLANSKWLEF